MKRPPGQIFEENTANVVRKIFQRIKRSLNLIREKGVKYLCLLKREESSEVRNSNNMNLIHPEVGIIIAWNGKNKRVGDGSRCFR